MSLPLQIQAQRGALFVPCPRRSHGLLNNGMDFHASLCLLMQGSWYDIRSSRLQSQAIAYPSHGLQAQDDEIGKGNADFLTETDMVTVHRAGEPGEIGAGY